MEEQNLIPFEGKEIRKAWHNEEWYFSVVDVVERERQGNEWKRQRVKKWYRKLIF